MAVIRLIATNSSICWCKEEQIVTEDEWIIMEDDDKVNYSNTSTTFIWLTRCVHFEILISGQLVWKNPAETAYSHVLITDHTNNDTNSSVNGYLERCEMPCCHVWGARTCFIWAWRQFSQIWWPSYRCVVRCLSSHTRSPLWTSVVRRFGDHHIVVLWDV